MRRKKNNIAELIVTLKKIIESEAGEVLKATDNEIIFKMSKIFHKLKKHCLETRQYHWLFGNILDKTHLPDTIRKNKLIPVVRAVEGNNVIKICFVEMDDSYCHFLDGKAIPMAINPMAVEFNPEACQKKDTSMLYVPIDGLGYTDENPRYMVTTNLRPCISVSFFDEEKVITVLGHFRACSFSNDDLEEIIGLCKRNGMVSIKCNIVGGTYQYSGLENGFLNLKKWLDSNGIPIKQIFVGDTSDRPLSVVFDTDNMTISGLPFTYILEEKEHNTRRFEQSLYHRGDTQGFGIGQNEACSHWFVLEFFVRHPCSIGNDSEPFSELSD